MLRIDDFIYYLINFVTDVDCTHVNCDDCVLGQKKVGLGLCVKLCEISDAAREENDKKIEAAINAIAKNSADKNSET